MNNKSIISVTIRLTIITIQCSMCNFLNAQDLTYANQEVLVYNLPIDLTSDNVQTTSNQIAADVVREVSIEVAGDIVTNLAGNIAGLIYSVIQEIPSVGNPMRLEFDVIPKGPIPGYSKFNISIFYEPGDSPRGISVSLQRHAGLFRWETIESRQLLDDDEVYKIPSRSLIILRQPFNAPNKVGIYRVTVAGVKREIEIMEIH